MKSKMIGLCLAVVISGCAIEPLPLTGGNGQLGFTMDCNEGIEKCYQKSAELCPAGYDIIEHTKKTSTLVPHYGQYPMTINIERLTIECR